MTVTFTVAPPGLRKKWIEKIGDVEGTTTNLSNSNATRHLHNIRNDLERERIRV
jgi:hypothetical protein